MLAGNSAKFGGAASASFTGALRVDRCTFTGNGATSAGAAIYLDTAASATLTNSILCPCYAHDEAAVDEICRVLDESLEVVATAVARGDADDLLEIPLLRMWLEEEESPVETERTRC